MIPTYLLGMFLEVSANDNPSKTALVCGPARLSYQALEQWANRLANALMSQGIERGDRVAIWLENSPGAAAAIFGVLKAGAAMVPINPLTKGNKLAYLLADCGCPVPAPEPKARR